MSTVCSPCIGGEVTVTMASGTGARVTASVTAPWMTEEPVWAWAAGAASARAVTRTVQRMA